MAGDPRTALRIARRLLAISASCLPVANRLTPPLGLPARKVFIVNVIDLGLHCGMPALHEVGEFADQPSRAKPLKQHFLRRALGQGIGKIDQGFFAGGQRLHSAYDPPQAPQVNGAALQLPAIPYLDTLRWWDTGARGTKVDTLMGPKLDTLGHSCWGRKFRLRLFESRPGPVTRGVLRP
jgi:hypothetical protein